MALTVKHLNGDASFFLSFEPLPENLSPGIAAEPFRILLDPWITGPSKIFHSKISISTHKDPACITSLRELPEPDLVIISQNKSDHCNEPTLRQLPSSGTKTIILAEPASARAIRSWRYFDKAKVKTIPKWEAGLRATDRQAVVRIQLGPIVQDGEPGEVTVAFIPQRRDISGLHGAIGITYRPPSSSPVPSIPRKSLASRSATPIFTPPPTPKSYRSYINLPRLSSHLPAQDCHVDPAASPTPTPLSPGLSSVRSLRSVRSASSLPLSVSSYVTGYTAATSLTNRSMLPAAAASSGVPASTTTATHTSERALSLIFSPHGISYSNLQSYTTRHLATEAALPLTALLHCFDSVSNPWWLGGNILLGAPAGTETAGRLGARAWISAHDGDKEVRGIATGLLKTRKWQREEVVGGLVRGLGDSRLRLSRSSRDLAGDRDRNRDWEGSARVVRQGESQRHKDRAGIGVESCRSSIATTGTNETEVISLISGEEVVLTSDGVWNVDCGSVNVVGGSSTSTPRTKPILREERKGEDAKTTTATVINVTGPGGGTILPEVIEEEKAGTASPERMVAGNT